MARQKTTNPDTPDWTLTPQQETAVDLLASGKTVTDTAAAVEVTRQTVSEWLNHHPGFQAALNRRRQELWADLIDGLRALAPKAVDVLKRELEGETPLPAALAILKSCGLTSANLRPSGPCTVEEVEQAQRQREVERTLTAISAEDVQLALKRRQQDRLMQELLL